ncbi:PEP-CTERM sorting domain-containing protein [Verrucomicrobiaceae bacterium R5-34]|uniref:PEP-CTERM sorting domain-containing protein n=1 Tax=Oceaniferula flava TaxID=2800421 RepID=A0AAE2SBL8_9BACT|nr:PEP-CTERM sorting domain-containing protein [Oceaniferula flavus]MBK1829983.1 PEP-CTERM sorting domain-containing protein [Verrucomicrobiaceae bacterium R5-34]MBK1855170.1 PEP-CTERM sorting domain-containing protein [Oceaniferula flavus]MBM1136476.1 PEP-CTERM sorting domain-containing protein [Oceaniferula flavus]
MIPSFKNTLFIATVSAGLFAFASAVQATVIVSDTTVEGNFGDDALFATDADNSIFSYAQKTTGSLAQTITTGAQGIDVSVIELMFESTLDAGGVDMDLTLHVFEVVDPAAATLVVPGSTLLTESFTWELVGGDNHLMRIAPSGGTSLILEANTSYAFYMDVSADTAADIFEWHRSTGEPGPYDGGIMYQDGTPKSSGTKDLALALDGTFIPVPEPSTTGLLGLGGLALLLRRRK